MIDGGVEAVLVKVAAIGESDMDNLFVPQCSACSRSASHFSFHALCLPVCDCCHESLNPPAGLDPEKHLGKSLAQMEPLLHRLARFFSVLRRTCRFFGELADCELPDVGLLTGHEQYEAS